MTEPLQPVAVVRALLLRAAMPDLPLQPGSSFVARVASLGAGGAASLVIAGELVAARVPGTVREGQTLRLFVAEVSPERVTLRMEPAQTPSAPPAAPPPPPPLRVQVDQQDAGSRARPGEAAVSITLHTAALGTLRLRVASAPGAVAATIQVPAAVLAAAQARAEDLRGELAARTQRTAAVHVVPASVDVRA